MAYMEEATLGLGQQEVSGSPRSWWRLPPDRLPCQALSCFLFYHTFLSFLRVLFSFPTPSLPLP